MVVLIAGIFYATRELDTLESISVVPYTNPPAAFPYVIVDSTQRDYAGEYVKNITSITGAKGVSYDTRDLMDAALSAGEGLLGYHFWNRI